ncbi:CPBP family intramembrane glutamic endopeptidase [Gluconacetobacter takamatsuzukensis]|uniref:CPBP family intramembrane metalloprotease n=1 Tax=Gluconacetobacter takamatsuzukensis TaxID=1286190 RepID=A0A7W4KFI6_9PROT|nr:CPBP family intramembrane glutamic endopeptidase [Gluconacetobacter takamatsuzukensis]MBB2205997.1 CPBP family intramembrane metalloprotease [Gluconacetobacter takamatsuzukensis]
MPCRRLRLRACLNALLFILVVAAIAAAVGFAAHIFASRQNHYHLPPLLAGLIANIVQALVGLGATAIMILRPDGITPGATRRTRFLPGGNLADLRWARHIVSGVAIGFAGAVTLMGTIWVLGGFEITLSPESLTSRLFIALLAQIVLFGCVALTEEVVFRGYIQRQLTASFGFAGAAITTSCLFGAAHMLGGTSLWGAVEAGALGLALCAMLHRTGSLMLPIGFHAAWDWTETALFGANDSGHAASTALLRTVPSGADWLTGGTNGPEGSIICMILSVAIITAFSMKPMRPTVRLGYGGN